MSLSRYKFFWTLAIVIYFCAGYYALNFFNLQREFYFDVCLPFEVHLPFFPVAILGYILVFAALLWEVFLLPDRHSFQKALVAAFAVSTVHFLFFWLMPVKMELRPALDQLETLSQSIWNPLVKFYFLIDQPTNCFPSLHVAYPTMAAWQIWKVAPRYRFHFVAMTLIVACSVVLVKQHYIADALAGVLLAMLTCWIVDLSFRHA